MVKTITIMDDAYEALKSKKGKEESFSDTIRRICAEKKIDLRQWLGVLKGKDRSAQEMNKEIMEERAKMSKDFDERMQKLKRKEHVYS